MSEKPTPANPTIIRAKHDASNEWFLTLRSSAQDKGLSFEARGILWYLLSKPDDWTVQVPDLMRAGGIGRDKVKKALVELANANYLMRPKKYKDKDGKWAWTPYVLYEAPFTENQSTEPSTEKPSTENQSLENRMTDSQSTLHNTENKVQKQRTENKVQKKQAASKSDAGATRIEPLIEAWLKTTGIIDAAAYSKKVHRDTAKAMLDAGITPVDVCEHTQEKKRDPFWSDKPIPLTEVAKTILPWKQKRTKPAPYAPETPLTEYYELGPDELAHMEAIRVAALEKVNGNARKSA